MKIVVTGGAGFIASHIVDAYLERGHEVHILDDFSTGQKTNLNAKATVHTIDIADAKAARLIEQIKPDVLSHHAAQMDVRHSVADPTFDARVNIIGFINLLEGCKNAGVKKVIFASSGGAVYGEQDVFPAPESHATEPASPYGVSKRTGELYLSYYRQAYGLPYIALRYANVYGPRQSAHGRSRGSGDISLTALFRQDSADQRRRQANSRLRLRRRRGCSQCRRPGIGLHRTDQYRYRR